MTDRCHTALRDPQTGAVIATVLGPRPLTAEEQHHMAAVVRAAYRLAAEDVTLGARQAEARRRIHASIAARAAMRQRLSAMRAAYRAKRRGRRR